MKVKLIKFKKDGHTTTKTTKHFEYKNSKTLKNIPCGEIADRVKLNIEFGAEDVQNIIEFLTNLIPCFKEDNLPSKE